jgi:hypothetical protein
MLFQELKFITELAERIRLFKAILFSFYQDLFALNHIVFCENLYHGPPEANWSLHKSSWSFIICSNFTVLLLNLQNKCGNESLDPMVGSESAMLYYTHFYYNFFIALHRKQQLNNGRSKDMKENMMLSR